MQPLQNSPKILFVAHAWGLLGALNLVNSGTQDAYIFFM
jgi:hypothetical protein